MLVSYTSHNALQASNSPKHLCVHYKWMQRLIRSDEYMFQMCPTIPANSSALENSP